MPLKNPVFTSASETRDSMAFGHSEKSTASRTAQVSQSIYPSVYLLRDTVKIAKSFRATRCETSQYQKLPS